ncbi:hypothetical protein RT717_03360 [Imperialibacter roseus]|uniref:Uncharacterized protein n=1 Tax=Imperialibacter roseus TaxID=1324217 RepID=A0ABZ0IUM7_9BACT|nr:hypothetical protein [Imperialibacter roseus]WOK07660.1 hypothetical protein RT717_03360 [Imperialibacter roseus]
MREMIFGSDIIFNFLSGQYTLQIERVENLAFKMDSIVNFGTSVVGQRKTTDGQQPPEAKRNSK